MKKWGLENNMISEAGINLGEEVTDMTERTVKSMELRDVANAHQPIEWGVGFSGHSC